MLNLKLAQYNSEGKFERFIECEYDEFGFYGDYIKVHYGWINEEFYYEKDPKDPLNRFGGLFDGRTYGDGRFVLIKDNDFEVYEQKFFTDSEEEFGYGISLNNKISCAFKNHFKFAGKYVNSTFPKLIGNLHQNPELYEKLK